LTLAVMNNFLMSNSIVPLYIEKYSWHSYMASWQPKSKPV